MRTFVWLGDRDTTSTHLVLEPGCLYNAGDVSESILERWLQEGKIVFKAPEAGDRVPEEVVLDVQDGIIKGELLVGYIEDGLKKGVN